MSSKLQIWSKSKPKQFHHKNLATTLIAMTLVVSLCIVATACSSSPEPEPINVNVEKSKAETQADCTDVMQAKDPVLLTWETTVEQWNTPGTKEYELAECVLEVNNLSTDPAAECPHLISYHRYHIQ